MLLPLGCGPVGQQRGVHGTGDWLSEPGLDHLCQKTRWLLLRQAVLQDGGHSCNSSILVHEQMNAAANTIHLKDRTREPPEMASEIIMSSSAVPDPLAAEPAMLEWVYRRADTLWPDPTGRTRSCADSVGTCMGVVVIQYTLEKRVWRLAGLRHCQCQLQGCHASIQDSALC